MNEDLALTKAGGNLIKHFEGIHKKRGPDQYAAYKCPAGVWTIGLGTTSENGHKITEGMVWSFAQCKAAFLSDVTVFEDEVRRLVKVDLEPWQFDALVSFVYNVGAGAFGGSTMLKKINAGDFEAAALEFHKWNKAKGKVLDGLVRRRASESLLFQNITDENYDGIADPVPLEDPMPQLVDAPAS